MFNLTNPFRRADKHGAPDMRPTAPASAEMPMPVPVNQMITLPSAEVPAEPPKSGVGQQVGRISTCQEISEFGGHAHPSPFWCGPCKSQGWSSLLTCARVNHRIEWDGRETGIARD